MTSIKVGRANEAFEASEEDDDVDSRYGKFSHGVIAQWVLRPSTVGIRCSLLIFQYHIFEGFDDILYIYTFF